MTKISLLIPCFNSELFLRQCLESVLRQDLKDCEVICFNDGSTDRTLEILNEYKDRIGCLSIIGSEQNGGVFAARHRLFEAATGEYIWFVDSDDMLMDGAVRHVRKKIASYSPDIVCFDYYKLDAGGNAGLQDRLIYCYGFGQRPDFSSFIVRGPLDILNVLFDTGGCQLWINVFRKELIASFAELNYSLSCFEDMPISTTLYSRAQKVLFDRNPVLIYRENFGSLTNTVTCDKIHDLLRAIRSAIEIYTSAGGSGCALTKFQCDQIGWVSYFLRNMAGDPWTSDDKSKAREGLARIRPQLLDVVWYQVKSRKRKYLKQYLRNLRLLKKTFKP